MNLANYRFPALPDGNDVPCKGMASYMLNLAKKLLVENCERRDGHLVAGEIEEIFNRLLKAPGDLPKIYASKFSRCSSAILHASANQDNPAGSFRDHFADIVGAATKAVSVGRLQTVGLNNIQSSLGDQWQALAKRVVEIAEHCITKRLTSYDTFSRAPNNEFVICFAELSGEEAMVKANAIERDITEMLLDLSGKGDLENFNLNAEQLDELMDLSVAAHEIEITPQDTTSDEFFDKLLGKLDNAASQLHEDTETILESLAHDCHVQPRLVLKLSGESTNTSLLSWDSESQAKLTQLKALCSNDSKILAKLDRISLLSAATYICGQRYSSLPILSIGVNFDTLNNRKSLSGYLDICRKLGSEVRNKIAFNVRIPRSQMRHYGVLDSIRILRSFCVALSIQIEEPSLESIDWETAGLSMVVMDYKNFLARTGKQTMPIRTFSEKLRAHGIRLLIDEVPNSANIGLLRKHGIEYYATTNTFS